MFSRQGIPLDAPTVVGKLLVKQPVDDIGHVLVEVGACKCDLLWTDERLYELHLHRDKFNVIGRKNHDGLESKLSIQRNRPFIEVSDSQPK